MRRLLVALIVLAMSLPVACRHHHALCTVCQREIHEGTRTIAADASGRTETFCCPRCALTEKETQGGILTLKEVADFQTGHLITAQAAIYVRGSDVNPCSHKGAIIDQDKQPIEICYDRCRPSVIAFSRAADAREFAETHGGVIEAYPALLAALGPAR